MVHLSCQAEDNTKELPWPFADYCIAYNWYIRDPRAHSLPCADSCCKKHKAIPDNLFERVKETDVYEQPPLDGWGQNSEVSGSKGAYKVQSTHLVKGWHPDFPPPTRGNDRRLSALELAIRHNMNCAPELLRYGFKIDEDELSTAITSAITVEHRFDIRTFLTLLGTGTKISPEILLKLPQRTIVQYPAKLWERMWTEMKDDLDMKGMLQTAVRKVMCEGHSADAAKQMVWDFVRHAPQAAAIHLDSFFLQIPEVTSANRNSLPIHAWIHAKTRMNTEYVEDPTWSYDNNALRPPPWQSALTRSLSRSPPSSPYQLQMCDTKVVHFRGILSLELFTSLCDLRYQQQVDLLDDCVTMQAVVCHAWRQWALKYQKLLLVEEVVQFLALLAWGMSPDPDNIVHLCSKMLFSVTALGRLMQDVCLCCLNVAYILRYWASVPVISFGDVVNFWNVPSHVFSVYLISTFWTTTYTVADDVQIEHGNDDHLLWLGIGTVLKGVAVAHRLQNTSLVGHLLIPIRDVFRDSFIIAMIVVLVVVVFVFMAFVYIAWKGASASEAKGAIVSTWINLVIGEPVMLTGDDGDDFEHPWSRYVLVSVTHLAFTIALLNVLMAMTMENYRGMGLKATSRFLRSRAELCRNTLWKRRVLLTVFCNWLYLSVGKLLFLLFAILLVVSSAVLLMTRVRVVVVFLVCGGSAEMLLTLFVLVGDTPVKPEKPVRETWWIEQHYLWVCRPCEEDTMQDEVGHALQQLCQGEAAEVLARLARRGRAARAATQQVEDDLADSASVAPQRRAGKMCRQSSFEHSTLANLAIKVSTLVEELPKLSGGLSELRREVADLSERQRRREEESQDRPEGARFANSEASEGANLLS